MSVTRVELPPILVLRLKELVALTGLSSSTIERYERFGLFPRRRRLGPRATGWLASEVHAWLDALPAVEIGRKRKVK